VESFDFGPGKVQLFDDGAVAQVVHPDGRRILLDDGVVHHSLHAWGGPLLGELGLREHLIRHTKTFIGYGDELPPHEVNYEQSMVAPLLELLVSAYQIAPDEIDGAELTRRLPWLTAFAADQPDVRLRHVPIRHWDGYWFGRLRLWGDVFPHYWSALSAVVYAAWPRELVTPEQAAWLDAAEDAILRANLVGFNADGSATCAFVYPS
jgi:hypothetical protein